MIEQTFAATFSRDDLACAIAEGMVGVARPRSASAEAAMALMMEQNPDLADACYRAADHVLKMMIEKLNAGEIQAGHA